MGWHGRQGHIAPGCDSFTLNRGRLACAPCCRSPLADGCRCGTRVSRAKTRHPIMVRRGEGEEDRAARKAATKAGKEAKRLERQVRPSACPALQWARACGGCVAGRGASTRSKTCGGCARACARALGSVAPDSHYPSVVFLRWFCLKALCAPHSRHGCAHMPPCAWAAGRMHMCNAGAGARTHHQQLAACRVRAAPLHLRH